MLSKRQRLTRAQVVEVLEKGRCVRGAHVSFVVLPSGGFGCCIVVSKKVARTAVARNALRRRLYALMPGCGVVSAHVVVITYPGCVGVSDEALKRELADLCARVGP